MVQAAVVVEDLLVAVPLLAQLDRAKLAALAAATETKDFVHGHKVPRGLYDSDATTMIDTV